MLFSTWDIVDIGQDFFQTLLSYLTLNLRNKTLSNPRDVTAQSCGSSAMKLNFIVEQNHGVDDA